MTKNQFIVKFKPLNYPFTINLGDTQLLKDSKEIVQNTSDTLFIKRSDNVRSYGYLKDTSNFFAFIYVIIGDEPEFRLITFNRKMEKISEASLINNNNPSIESNCIVVKKIIQIKNENLIKSIKIVNYLKCDENDNLLGGNISSKTITQDISINVKGVISKKNH